MPTLNDYDLKLIHSPPDGACFYWSAGLGRGEFDEQAFMLNGRMRSPVKLPQARGSPALLKSMRAARECVWRRGFMRGASSVI